MKYLQKWFKNTSMACILWGMLIPYGRTQSVQLAPLHLVNEFFFMDQLWQVSLHNTTQEPKTGMLEIRIEQGNSSALVFSAVSVMMTLRPGVQQLPATARSGMNLQYANSSLGTALRQTGKLPYGQYTVCYQFRGEDNTLLGVICREKTIRPLAPPELISPVHQSVIETTQPILMWRAPYPLQSDGLKYALRLTEVPHGMNAAEALRTRAPLLNLNQLNDPYLPYPLSAMPLDTNKNYVWQVSAQSNGFDLGATDMWTFRIAPPIPDSLKTQFISYCWVKDYEDGSYCYPSDSLKFVYDNITGDTLLRYTIIDHKNDTIQTILPVVKIQTGMNPIIFPLNTLGNIAYNRSYRLRIVGLHGKRLNLEFRRRRSD